MRSGDFKRGLLFFLLTLVLQHPRCASAHIRCCFDLSWCPEQHTYMDIPIEYFIHPVPIASSLLFLQPWQVDCQSPSQNNEWFKPGGPEAETLKMQGPDLALKRAGEHLSVSASHVSPHVATCTCIEMNADVGRR